MGFLRMLQTVRTPLLDGVLGAVTLLGEETFFTVLGLLIYWCVNKKWGMRILLTGLVSTVLNQMLKAIFIVPRPWVIDPTFQIVEAARAAATGYSFPSGHTQSAITLFGMLALWWKNRAAQAAGIALALAVGFSRMYLGVHTPLDVSVALVMGALTVMGMHWILQRYDDAPKGCNAICGGVLVLALGLLALVELLPARANNIAEFDAHGVENAWKLLGTIGGLLIAWQLDARRVHFDVRATPKVQIVKVVVGTALVLAVRAGFKPVLGALFFGHPAAGLIRYLAVGLVAAALWPMAFERLNRRLAR